MYTHIIVVDRVHDLADNVQRFVHITEHNISNIFAYFCDRVLKNKNSISPNNLVSIFIGLITKDSSYFKHPMKANMVSSPIGEFQIDSRAFDAFFKYFGRDYTPKEKRCFSEISDRLIEDVKRRRNGEFFTPTLFVDYAHRMIENVLGNEWKEKYVVWDNCWGTGNLTRDYRFNELYASTLEQSELAIGKRYNPEACKFQYDFLQSDCLIDNEIFPSNNNLPSRLIDAFNQKKPIVFFMNPPYATACTMGANTNSKGNGATDSAIQKLMVNAGLGNASNNLYAQFLYKIILIARHYKLTDCYICLFSPTLFLTGSAYNKFRKILFEQFHFCEACQFKASHFADVADNWGISFSIWKTGCTNNVNEFPYALVDVIDDEIRVVGNKMVYNVDNGVTAKKYIKTPIGKLKTFERPTLSTGINIKSGKNSKTKLALNALGCYYNVANNVEHSASYVALYTSSDSSNANGISVMPENFRQIMSIFSARKLIDCNWINSKDEFLAPNETHALFDSFVNDSIIYSLFHSASNQSSLRHIEYKGKFWDIKNEFFWMSKGKIMELAETSNNDFCYNDACSSDERYVYKLLQDGLYDRLSNEAKAVLDKAIDLVRISFPQRIAFDEDHPEYQINTWDAGFYQLKALWNERFKQDLSELRELYKILSDKMRPMVYELGFLK